MSTDSTDRPFADSDTFLSPALQPNLLDAPEHRQQRMAVEVALFGGTVEAVSIGRYRLLNRLGEGGMGTVYAAFDDRLDRKIAIKLIRPSHLSSVEIRDRMLREARALARLSHPNVVHVYEVGEIEGQLFVAMEFVAGSTLRGWLQARARQWPEILRVFRQAGEGLAAAHAEGLIHRDFKPDNVMLGDDQRVRVMDFGLARVVAERDAETTVLDDAVPQVPISSLTHTGALLGTPAYMSSEQLQGKPANACSDQFGFCVALYEALYGVRPFAGTSVAELISAVSRGQVLPAPAGTAVPAWLRKIVVRGLANEPEERWPSMRGLLAALADDPTLRRRKWWATGIVAALLGGSAWGLTVSVRQDTQTCLGMDEPLEGVWDDSRRAELKAAIEGTQLSYAAATWERIEQRLDDYTQRWVAARVEACEATLGGKQSGELLDLRMACLDERLRHVRATVDVLAKADGTNVKEAIEVVAGLPSLQRCADVEALTAEVPPPEDPKVAERVAELDEQLVTAEALERFGQYDEARTAADAVVSEAERLGYEPLQVRAWLPQALLQSRAGESKQAEATLERAYEAAVGHRMTNEAARAAALLITVVGSDQGRHEDGRRWAKDAKPLARAVGTDLARAAYLHSFGNLATDEGDEQEARGYYEESLAIWENALGPEDPRVADALLNLGAVAELLDGNHEEARGYYERALAISEKALGPEHPKVAVVLTHLGGIAMTEGKYGVAREYMNRALAVSEKALGPEHLDVAFTLTRLGNLAFEEHEFDEAREYYERALVIREKVLGSEHPEVAICLGSLGHVLERQGKYEEARGYLERTLAIFEKALGPEHPNVSIAVIHLGELAMMEGKREEARRFLERGLAIQEKVVGSDHPMVAGTLMSLGALAQQDGRYEDAREYQERALAIYEKTLGPDHPAFALVLVNLGELAFESGEYDEARDDYERALTISELALGPDHSQIAYALSGLGMVLLAQDRLTDARPHLERALTILSSNADDPIDLANTRFALARALWDASVDNGRDRPRALSLAALARTTYVEAGEASAKELEAVETWQRKHAE